MPDRRFWSPEPNCKLNFFAGDKLEYPPVKDWFHGGNIPEFHAPYSYKAFRVSLFWSLYVTPDILLEVEIDDATKAAGFWAPKDPKWRTSHIYGFQLVTKLNFIRVVGNITPQHVLVFLTKLEQVNLRELENTQYWRETGLRPVESYSDAAKLLAPLEHTFGGRNFQNIPRQIIYQLEQTQAQVRAAIYFLNEPKLIRHNQPAMVRAVIGQFALAIAWASFACNEPGDAALRIPVEWFKNYRTLVNDLMLSCIDQEV